MRSYRQGDESSILSLFNQVFRENDPDFQPRTLAEWRWLFDRNPAGRQITLAVERGGRVIAQFACLPARAQVGDEVVIAGQGIDSMVHADYRRGLRKESAFLRAARGYVETMGRWPVCGFGYGFPNGRALAVGVRFIGYLPVARRLPTLYRNFHEEHDDDEVGRAHAGAAEVDEIERFGPEIDDLWRRLHDRFPFSLVRDARYLGWRYDGCPWLHYRKFLIRERGSGTIRGFFVTRSNWQKRPIQALVDYLADPDDESSLALALRTTTHLAREAGQVRVEAWLPEWSAPFRHALCCGFRTEPCQLSLVVRLYRERPTLEWVRTHWYYTIGDSDVF